jgi:glucosamine--fructose-6-phosphate aminotransferase (isomerizing)
MCGIVGYVGRTMDDTASTSSWRGWPARVPGVRLGRRGARHRGRCRHREAVGQAGEPARALEAHPLAPPSRTGIGHTRWATHGGPTDGNAHPHRGGTEGNRLALIHNGIIENFHSLKTELLAEGVEFSSETDTEVAASSSAASTSALGDLTEAMRAVVSRLEGAFTLLAVHADSPGVVVGARRNSPLVVGLGEGENFLGSDVAAFIGYTRHALELGQDQIVTITPDGYEVIGFDGTPAEGKAYEVTGTPPPPRRAATTPSWRRRSTSSRTRSPTPCSGAPTTTAASSSTSCASPRSSCGQIDKIVIVACGTAAYSGMVAKYAIEHWTRIPVEVELAHEFRYRDPIVDEHPRGLISQSGETMDTLMAVKHARELGALTLSICNTHGSTIPRESDAVLYTHAGPEIAVASTKALPRPDHRRATARALPRAAARRETRRTPRPVMRELRGHARQDPDRARPDGPGHRDRPLHGRHPRRCSSSAGTSATRSRWRVRSSSRRSPTSTPRASRPASSSTARSRSSSPGQPVFIVVPGPDTPHELHKKVVSNIQEIRARGARTLVIAEDGDEDVVPFADEVIRVPATPPLLMPLLTIVPLQVFALHLATAKGLDVDQPRNLAKSVTVE